jgi:hypothetical protein
MEDMMGRTCSPNVGEEEGIYDISGKPEGKRPLGSPRRRWVEILKLMSER